MSFTPSQEMARRDWMSLLAKAPTADLLALCDEFGQLPSHAMLRPPEIGGVMVRGRAGAVGESFNLGEITVTRCSIQLESGEVGHAYVQGRNRDKARQAAIIDAMMQTDRAAVIDAAILAPLRDADAQRKAARAAKAAATKVDFFTMVRGED